jgi:hypothetical protein
MEQVKGQLKELGDSVASSRTPFMSYSYVQVGDRLLKGVKCFNGLDGKFRLQLGRDVTLHVKGSTIVAVQTDDGKLYSSEKSTAGYVIGLGLIGLGLPFCFVLIGFPFLALGLYLTWLTHTANSGANLPNAIQLPR